MRKHTIEPNCGKVLLVGLLSDNVQTALEEENQPSHDKVALLETVESLEETGFNEFLKNVEQEDLSRSIVHRGDVRTERCYLFLIEEDDLKLFRLDAS